MWRKPLGSISSFGFPSQPIEIRDDAGYAVTNPRRLLSSASGPGPIPQLSGRAAAKRRKKQSLQVEQAFDPCTDSRGAGRSPLGARRARSSPRGPVGRDQGGAIRHAMQMARPPPFGHGEGASPGPGSAPPSQRSSSPVGAQRFLLLRGGVRCDGPSFLGALIAHPDPLWRPAATSHHGERGERALGAEGGARASESARSPPPPPPSWGPTAVLQEVGASGQHMRWCMEGGRSAGDQKKQGELLQHKPLGHPRDRAWRAREEFITPALCKTCSVATRRPWAAKTSPTVQPPAFCHP